MNRFDLEKTQTVQHDGIQHAVEAAQCNDRMLKQADPFNELFRYHSPNPEDVQKYAAINQAAKNFAEVVRQNCPYSADYKDAIRKIREARMTANAAIALNGLGI